MRIGSAERAGHRPARRLLERPGGVGALAVSLFGGEITIDSLDVRASVAAGSANASANVSASSVTGLTVLGQLITPSANVGRSARRLGEPRAARLGRRDGAGAAPVGEGDGHRASA